MPIWVFTRVLIESYMECIQSTHTQIVIDYPIASWFSTDLQKYWPIRDPKVIKIFIISLSKLAAILHIKHPIKLSRVSNFEQGFSLADVEIHQNRSINIIALELSSNGCVGVDFHLAIGIQSKEDMLITNYNGFRLNVKML